MKEQILNIIQNTTTNIDGESYCIKNKDLNILAEKLNDLFALHIVSIQLLINIINMKTQKQIKLFLGNRIEQISYDIEYSTFKKEEVMFYNLQNKLKMIKEICIGLGLDNNFIITNINKGRLTFEKDINN